MVLSDASMHGWTNRHGPMRYLFVIHGQVRRHLGLDLPDSGVGATRNLPLCNVVPSKTRLDGQGTCRSNRGLGFNANYIIPRTSDAGYACREQRHLGVGGFPRGVEVEVAEAPEVHFCAYDG